MRHEPLAASQTAQALGLQRDNEWTPGDHRLGEAVATANSVSVQEAIEADPELTPAPRLRKTPLDSPGGLNAVAAEVKKLNLPATPDMVEFFSESWMHPRLRVWGTANGFVSSVAPNITLDLRVGHFDHAPYALNSTFGRQAVPTPFQTTRYGQIFLVEYDRRNKAHVIATQVRDDVSILNSLPGSQSPSSHFPLRNSPEWWLGIELMHHINDLREGLGVSSALGNSQEYGNRLIESAKVGLAMLLGSELRDRLQGSLFPEQSKKTVLEALARLEPLAPVLGEVQEAWDEEIQRRQEWRDDLRARLAASEAREQAAREAPDGELFI